MLKSNQPSLFSNWWVLALIFLLTFMFNADIRVLSDQNNKTHTENHAIHCIHHRSQLPRPRRG